jgi:threonine dehydrogenase-like Zn-dependent dehydrogenase
VCTGLAGICGSDVKQVILVGTLDNPLTTLITFYQVLGREVAVAIHQVGSAVTQLHAGQRVVLNLWLSCEPRGIRPMCDAYQRGEH